MALGSEHTAHALPEPADESHLPDAVSRPNLANGTRWYDDSALASSPILKNEGLFAARARQNGPASNQTVTLKALGPSAGDGVLESRGSYDGDEEDVSTPIEDDEDSPDLPEPPSDPYSIGDERPSFDNDSGGEDLNSTPLSVKDLSARADQIMANARRRLNLVNGGLRGARSSLLLSPTSNSSFESQLRKFSPDSPPLEHDENSIDSEPNLSKSSDSLFTSSRHKRITSDTSLPSVTGSVVQGSRSLEHMRNKDYNSRQAQAKASADFGNLGPVPENEFSTDSPRTSINGYPPRPASQNIVGHGGIAIPVPPREQSLAFRDFQARANNVQDKLASLRKRNREDAERRRSLQASRPSLTSLSSTASDYANDYGKDADENRGVNGEGQITPPRVTQGSENDEFTQQDSNEVGRHEIHPTSQDEDSYHYGHYDREVYADYDDHNDEDDTDFYSIMQEAEYEEDEDDDELPPVEGAHEDRADAFDYESFILSSLTGSLDRPRSSSIASSDSASTAKAPDYQSDEDNADDGDREGESWAGYNQVNASVSSFNSFATAIEGEEESDAESDGMEQSWPMPPSSNIINNNNHTTNSNNNRSVGPSTHSRQNTNGGGTVLPEIPTKRPASMALSALLGGNTTSPALTLNQDDQALVYTMAEKIREICQRLSSNSAAAESDAQDWRKRLDSAMRILEGQDVGATA